MKGSIDAPNMSAESAKALLEQVLRNGPPKMTLHSPPKPMSVDRETVSKVVGTESPKVNACLLPVISPANPSPKLVNPAPLKPILVNPAPPKLLPVNPVASKPATVAQQNPANSPRPVNPVTVQSTKPPIPGCPELTSQMVLQIRASFPKDTPTPVIHQAILTKVNELQRQRVSDHNKAILAKRTQQSPNLPQVNITTPKTDVVRMNYFRKPSTPLACRLKPLTEADLFTRLYHDIMAHIKYNDAKTMKHVHLIYFGKKEEMTKHLGVFRDVLGYLCDMGFGCFLILNTNNLFINVVDKPQYFAAWSGSFGSGVWTYKHTSGQVETIKAVSGIPFSRLLVASLNTTPNPANQNPQVQQKAAPSIPTPKPAQPVVAPKKEPETSQDSIPELIDLSDDE
jgi:hypothetical protein